MPTHINIRNQELTDSFEGVQAYQRLAEHYGIDDIFQDAGGKMLQILVRLGLDISPGRAGPDARDRSGNLYEIKTLDESKSNSSSFTTNHHLTRATIEQYRKRKWIFGIYHGIELMELYMVNASDLEVYFSHWEERLDKGKSHINNPKIPLRLVREVGELAYSRDVVPDWMINKVEKSSAAK